jgi:hypothetical protein
MPKSQSVEPAGTKPSHLQSSKPTFAPNPAARWLRSTEMCVHAAHTSHLRVWVSPVDFGGRFDTSPYTGEGVGRQIMELCQSQLSARSLFRSMPTEHLSKRLPRTCSSSSPGCSNRQRKPWALRKLQQVPGVERLQTRSSTTSKGAAPPSREQPVPYRLRCRSSAPSPRPSTQPP